MLVMEQSFFMKITIIMEIKNCRLSIATDIEGRPKAKYIAFVRKNNFVEVSFFKSSLKLYLSINNNKLNISNYV